MLSEEVLLRGESDEGLQELSKRLRADLKPMNEIEMLLTERIISNTWRLKRVLRLETELIVDLDGHFNFGSAFNAAAYGDVFGKYVRYEASIEKGLYKALHELQRLQAARNGGNVLAPIAIDVSMTEE